MVQPIPLARSTIISPIIEFLNSIGTSVDLHLNRVNLPFAVLENPETLAPLPMMINFVAKTARAEGIENLGIAAAKTSKINNLGMFGYLMCQSFNTYDLIKRLCQFIPYTTSIDGEKFWLIEEEENVWLCQKFVKPLNTLPGIDSCYYYTLILMVDCLRLTLGNNWQPSDIYIPTSPYKGLEEQINLDNTRLHYHKSYIAIAIPRKLLGVSVNNSQRLTISSSELSFPEWKKKAPDFNFIESLEQTLKILLLEKYPTIKMAAEASGLSVRSLQRYLSQNNLTYSRLIDKVRYELALSLMNESDIPLIEIAYTTGFQDPANFSHAFRRWTGMCPSKFRQYSLST